MPKNFNRKRPAFPRFRHLFLEVLKEHGHIGTDHSTPWSEVGTSRERSLILAGVRDRLIDDFGLGESLEIKPDLVNLDGSVESVISQLFHSFSTLTLVEHINDTVLEKQEANRRRKKN